VTQLRQPIGPSRTVDESNHAEPHSRVPGNMIRPSSRVAKSVGLTASHPSPRGAQARSAPPGL